MQLYIKNEATCALARQLAAETGESISRAVHRALEEKLKLMASVGGTEPLADDQDRLGLQCSTLPSDKL